MNKLKWLIDWWNYYYFGSPPPRVSSINLNKDIIAFESAWETFQLIATIIPSDALDKRIVWSSTNNNIATVDQNWLVTCVSPWTCTITVTSVDWWITASCNILTRTLFEETYISTSTSWWDWIINSKNWKITTGWWWYDRRMYSIWTIDWYDVVQIVPWTSHQAVQIWLTTEAYNELTSNYNKIRIVYDYLNIWSLFTYDWDWWSTLSIGNEEYYRTRNNWTITYWNNWWSLTLEWSKWYFIVQDINLSDMSSVVKIKDLSNNQEQTLTYTKTFNTNSLWPVLVEPNMDQKWWPISVWDIHIYVI